MRIKVRMSPLLRQLSQLGEDRDTLDVLARDPIQCLDQLTERFPSMKKWVYDGSGKLLPQVQFFINGQKLLKDELSNPLKEEDELFIVLAIGGG